MSCLAFIQEATPGRRYLNQQRCRDPGLLLAVHAARRAALFGCLCDRFSDGGGNALIEDARDHVILGEGFLWDHGGDRLGGELHLLVYLASPDV